METDFFGINGMQKVKRTLYSNLQKGKNNLFGYSQRETSYEVKYFELLSRLHQTLSDVLTNVLNQQVPASRHDTMPPKTVPGYNQQQVARRAPPKTTAVRDYGRNENATRQRAGYSQRETSFEEKYFELLSRLHQTLSDYTQDLNKLKPYENQLKLLENLTKSIQQEAAKDNPPKVQNAYEYTRTKTIHQKKVEQTITERVPASRHDTMPPKTVPGYSKQQVARRPPPKTTAVRDYGRNENATRQRAGGYRSQAAKASSSAIIAKAHLKGKVASPDKDLNDIFVRYENSANVCKRIRRCAACSDACRPPSFYP